MHSDFPPHDIRAHIEAVFASVVFKLGALCPLVVDCRVTSTTIAGVSTVLLRLKRRFPGSVMSGWASAGTVVGSGDEERFSRVISLVSVSATCLHVSFQQVSSQ